jgi:hypothetical protein
MSWFPVTRYPMCDHAIAQRLDAWVWTDRFLELRKMLMCLCQDFSIFYYPRCRDTVVQQALSFAIARRHR